MQSIEIPQKVKSLSSAFRFCYSLKSIQLNNSLKRIDEAFGGCESLTSITIPNSVKIIGSGAFRSCTALKSIIIPDSVLLIGPGCFSGCTALKTVKLPNNKYCKINYYAFQDCSSLESITIPQNIVAVGGAFTDCSSLKTIKIYKGATINEKTFFNCPKAKIQWIDDNIPSSSYQNKESNSNKFRLSTTTTEGASKTAVTPAPSTNKTRHKTYTSSTTTTKPSTTTTTTSGFNLKGLVKVSHKNKYNRTAESLQRNVQNFTAYDLMEKIMGVIEKPSKNLDFNTVFSKLRKAYPEMSEISKKYGNDYEFDNLTIRCNNVTAFPEITFENGKYSKVEYDMFFNNMKEAVRFAKQIKADIENHGYSLEVYEEKSNNCPYGLYMEGLHLTIMTITYKYVDTKCYVVKIMTQPFSYEKTNKAQTTTLSPSAL